MIGMSNEIANARRSLMKIEIEVNAMSPESATYLGHALENGDEGFIKDYNKA